jgi:hypothetical protein
MVCTGKLQCHDIQSYIADVCKEPLLITGDELATAASQTPGIDMKFEDISECVPIS